jgi:5-formyltetrahydrofolate cyclo-ligase
LPESKAEIAVEKAALRKVLQARRADAAEGDCAAPIAAAALARRFPGALIPGPGAIVAAYVPFRTEISPVDLLGRLEAAGCVTALPRTPPRGAQLPLSFHLAPPLAAMERSAFGVLEPPADAPVAEPDLILVPLLGFDRRGYRIGYGQGHYDRTLAALRARKTILAIGVAWACQEVDRIPIDAFDQRLDWVVTESEAIGPPA